MLNGFGYAMFGVPSRDLETTWKSECNKPRGPGQLPLLLKSPEPTQWSVSSDIFNSILLYEFLNIIKIYFLSLSYYNCLMDVD